MLLDQTLVRVDRETYEHFRAVLDHPPAGEGYMILGLRGLFVHALSEKAAAFYAHQGFVALPTNPLTLVLSLKRT